jgi:hypothetical protein
MNETLVHIQHLQNLSTQLNRSSDLLTELLKEVEAKLAALRLGIEAWILAKPAVDGIGMHLGYAKHNGGWRLVVGFFREDPDYIRPCGEVSVLLESPRADWVTAVQHLPALVTNILEKANKEAAEVEKGRVAAESALALLR